VTPKLRESRWIMGIYGDGVHTASHLRSFP